MKIFTEGMLFKVDGSLSLTEYAAHSYLDLDYMNCYSILNQLGSLPVYFAFGIDCRINTLSCLSKTVCHYHKNNLLVAIAPFV